MSAVKRVCFYSGCPNTFTSGRSFFKFPLRDEDRLQQWIEISGCTQAEARTASICDAHFDPRFMVRSQRRKILLGKAVPMAPPVNMPTTHEYYYYLGGGGETESNDNKTENNTESDTDPNDGEIMPDDKVVEHIQPDVEASAASEADDYADGMHFDACGMEFVYNHSNNTIIAINPPDPVPAPTYAMPDTDQKLSVAPQAAVSSSTPPSNNKLMLVRGRPYDCKSNVGGGNHKSVLLDASAKRPRVSDERDSAVPEAINPPVVPAHNEPNAPPAKRPSTLATEREIKAEVPTLPTQAKIVSIRGMEHVQMPLFVYEGEQKLLREELKYWKNIVREFRDKLVDVDFS